MYETVTFTATGDIDARGSFTFDANPQPYRHFPDATYPIGATINYLEFGGVTSRSAFYQPSDPSDHDIISSTYDGSLPLTDGNNYALFFNFPQGYLEGSFVAALAQNPGYMYYDQVHVTITYSTNSTVTPEPSSIALLGTGLFGVAGIVKRRLT